MCDKAVDTCPLVFDFVSDLYKSQEICDKAVFKELFMLTYCLDIYKTQKISDKAVDAFLPTLNFVLDWYITSKMLEKLDNVVFSNDDIDLNYIDSDINTFFSNDMGQNIIDIIIIILILMKMILLVLFMLDLLLGVIDLKIKHHVKEISKNNACSMASNKMVGLVHFRR